MPQSAIVRVTRWISWRTLLLAFGRVRFAVEILADDDVGRQCAPGLGNFAVGLLEEDVAGFVLDLGRPLVPCDGVERILIDRAKLSSHFHRRPAVAALDAACR